MSQIFPLHFNGSSSAQNGQDMRYIDPQKVVHSFIRVQLIYLFMYDKTKMHNFDFP